MDALHLFNCNYKRLKMHDASSFIKLSFVNIGGIKEEKTLKPVIYRLQLERGNFLDRCLIIYEN